VPYNPLIAESLYLTRYIEKVGSGTQTMINLCRDAGLPEPQFEQRVGSFVVTPRRDWLTDRVMAELGLDERQLLVMTHIRSSGRIANAEYQQVTGAGRKTAGRDLDDLVDKHALVRVGEKRGSHHILARRK
jgi:ATP-dependent DNA helicase RecG